MARIPACHAYLGGLRNPLEAVARSPNLRFVGTKVSCALASLYKNEKISTATNLLVDGLGSADVAPLDADVLRVVSQVLLRIFEAEQDMSIGAHSRADTRSSYCDALWESMLREASDPEISLPTWMRDGAPAGIHQRITCHGVFPPAEGPTKQVEASRAHAQANVRFDSAHHVNYRSFYESMDGEVMSKSEIDGLLQQGFVEQFDRWERIRELWPDAVASRVACVSKRRLDNSLKLRLILDLLRSGVNGDCLVPEKVPLPRLDDYVNSILGVLDRALMEGYAPAGV